jgi:uncharacterized membrane protein YkvA (DUF1232 family)
MNDKQLETKKNGDKAPLSDFARKISEPLSKRGWPVWLVYIFAFLGVLYMLNPTAGIFEFIPDNIPFIGNIDEGVAFMLILAGLVELFEGTKQRKAKKQADKKAAEPMPFVDGQIIDGEVKPDDNPDERNINSEL